MTSKKISRRESVSIRVNTDEFNKKRNARVFSALTIAPLLVAVAAGSLAVYFYLQLNRVKIEPQSTAEQETKDLISRIGKLIVLPTDEEPTIATVQDPEKLKDQPFFSKAKVGDKVLIYTNAKKAILYDPDRDIIVEVAPLNIGEPLE